MFQIKHHNFRYRPKIPIKQEISSFSSEVDEIKSHYKLKMQRAFPYSVSGHSGILKKGKVQLQPLKTGQKFYSNEGKFQSTPNKNYQQQIQKFPKMTGEYFFKSRKNVHVSFKLGLTNDSLTTNRTKTDNKFWYVDSIKGKRSYNEDRYIVKEKCGSFRQPLYKTNAKNEFDLFGIFDGHGGSQCSQFIKNNIIQILSTNKNILVNQQSALTQCFSQIQSKFLGLCQKKGVVETSGSCALLALVFCKKIYLANIGDSRALLLSMEEVEQLSRDHKPEDKNEKMRIIQHGGKLIKQEGMKKNLNENFKVFSQTRIMPGSLNVSRTIGDIEVKLRKYGGSPGMILSEPQITIHQTNQSQHLLLGSDGLFEGLTNQQIHEIYKKIRRQHGFASTQKLVQLIGQQLMQKASQNSRDNITLILVKLN